MFEHGLKSLPLPLRDGLNASLFLERRRSKQRFDFDRYHWGYGMTPNEIRFSSRALLDYLAGRLERDRFVEIVGSAAIDFLKCASDSGRLLESLSVEYHPELDDDYAILKFGAPDPAVSSFVTRGVRAVSEKS